MKLDALPRIRITPAILATAHSRKPQIRRTPTSEHGELVGAIGEAAFSSWYFGSLEPRSTPGEIDFGPIEVKCSQVPLNPRLNLLVREDYARKRAAPFYVQCVVDIDKCRTPEAGDEVVFIGWTTHDDLMRRAELRDWGSKRGGSAGYKCFCVPFSRLKPMSRLRAAVEG